MQSHVKDLRIFMNAWKMADEQELNALRDVLRKACETVEALGNKNTSGSSSNTGRSSSVTGPPVTGTEMEKLFPNIYGKRGKRPGNFNVTFRQKLKKKVNWEENYEEVCMFIREKTTRSALYSRKT